MLRRAIAHSLHVRQACTWAASVPSPSGIRGGFGCSVRVRGSLLVLGFLLELARSLIVLLFDLVELLHVLKEVGTSLQGDEQFGLLAVSALVVTSVAGGLNCDGLCSDLLEGSVVVSETRLTHERERATRETLTNFQQSPA